MSLRAINNSSSSIYRPNIITLFIFIFDQITFNNLTEHILLIFKFEVYGMLNMKKLIDETDFDNLSELTKQWKPTPQSSVKPSHKKTTTTKYHNKQIEEQKQNNSYASNEIREIEREVDLNYPQNTSVVEVPAPKKRNVIPQVIDEDTEHFKNKLQHLLNNFKVDAVSEFMSMKKEMLDYQKQCVKTDTHKYLTMYEEKHQELLQTKQKLLAVSREAQKKTIQVQLLSDHIAKLNNRLKSIQCLSVPFAVLYQNKEREKMMKFKLKQAQVFDEKRLKRKSIWSWIGQYKQNKNKRIEAQNQERVESEVNQIVGRFQKQMEMLKQQLEEANRKNQQYENNKVMLQQNLKKAFLRGVTAMNMEAMGVLSENAEEDQWYSQKEENQTTRTNKERSFVATNMSYADQTKNSNLVDSYAQNQSMLVTKNRQTNMNDSRNTEIMMVSQPKSESKNHKWKEAPIMGIEEKVVNQEPRMQVVRPTTQGKVIKVVDGRSALDKKSIHQESANRNTATRKKF